MDKFVEIAKQKLFYESDGGTDNVRLMLSRTQANSRVNEEMARWEMAVLQITACWTGAWKHTFAPLAEMLEDNFMNLNGYSRVQAIEMAGQQSIGEKEVLAEKERGGILGLFSGGKK